MQEVLQLMPALQVLISPEPTSDIDDKLGSNNDSN